jgi:hypothetical protein
MFMMQPWGNQIDELVDNGSYAEALALIETLDDAILQDKVCFTAKFASWI